MKTLALVLALALPTTACVVGSGDPLDDDNDGTGGGDGNGGGGGNGGGMPATIDAPVTWSGTVAIERNTTIAAGVTVTIEAGAIINFSPSASLTINGTLDANGTKAAPITIGSSVANQFWGGFKVPTGGSLDYAYVNQTGGGITTQGGSATIVDSYMSGVSGDFLVMSGGTVDIQYSQVGRNAGETDSTHCDLHFDGVMPNNIKVTRSNISTTPYGVMFYKGTGADFTFNNWFGNEIDVATSPGVVGDFSGSWFEGTPPAATGQGGAQLTLDALAAARLTDAGPR